MRLSVLNVAGGDQVFWNGETGSVKADHCERMGCGGYDREAIGGKCVKELFGTRQCDDVPNIRNLGFFNGFVLGAMIGGGQ
jgi:hypothetical protein